MILPFDVYKHRPTDQSQQSMSEIFFHVTEHVLNCKKVNFEIYLFRKLTVHAINFLAMRDEFTEIST